MNKQRLGALCLAFGSLGMLQAVNKSDKKDYRIEAERKASKKKFFKLKDLRKKAIESSVTVVRILQEENVNKDAKDAFKDAFEKKSKV